MRNVNEIRVFFMPDFVVFMLDSLRYNIKPKESFRGGKPPALQSTYEDGRGRAMRAPTGCVQRRKRMRNTQAQKAEIERGTLATL